jgi:hypothetical protein
MKTDIVRPRTAFDGIVADKNQLAALGYAIGAGMARVQKQHDMQYRPRVLKEASLDADLLGASIYGRNSIFDPCAPGDIFGLQVQTIGFLSWVGWRPNRFYRRRVEFIPWYGPQGTAGVGEITSGAGAPCADPHGVEFGNCGYDLCHTSWYHRKGNSLDPHTIVQERCETSPRYRVNGVQISDDLEWQMNLIENVMQQDLAHDVVHGSHQNAFEMNGLESLIKTGWTDADDTPCSVVDSILVAWAHDDLDGLANGFGNFFDYLDEVVTEIEWKAQKLGPIMENDMVLLTSRFMATCLLDAYACYTTCGVTALSDTTEQALRSQQRAERMKLNAGPLYDGASAVGFIPLKSGRRVPIIVDDAIEFNHPNANWCTDIYLLTRRIGSMDVFYGEYLDMRLWASKIQKYAPGSPLRSDAAGRYALTTKWDNFCLEQQMGHSPELYLSAPWAQVRFSDVCCSRKRQPMSGDIFANNAVHFPGGRPVHHATRTGACGDCTEEAEGQTYQR